MAVDMLIFAIMAKSYKYKSYSNDEDSSEDDSENIQLEDTNGHVNASFSANEENMKLWNFVRKVTY